MTAAGESTLAERLQCVLAGLVQRHATENLHLLLPEWIGEPDDAGDRRRAA